MGTPFVIQGIPPMKATNTAAVLLARGVHEAEYLVDGHPVLLAIDSQGNCVRRVKMAPDVHEGVARAYLNGLLDHYDPVRPPLRLVKSPLCFPRRSWYIPRLGRQSR